MRTQYISWPEPEGTGLRTRRPAALGSPARPRSPLPPCVMSVDGPSHTALRQGHPAPPWGVAVALRPFTGAAVCCGISRGIPKAALWDQQGQMCDGYREEAMWPRFSKSSPNSSKILAHVRCFFMRQGDPRHLATSSPETALRGQDKEQRPGVLLLTLFPAWNPLSQRESAAQGRPGRRASQALPMAPPLLTLGEWHHNSVTVGTGSCQSCLSS